LITGGPPIERSVIVHATLLSAHDLVFGSVPPEVTARTVGR
jgi:hypothetical protein